MPRYFDDARLHAKRRIETRSLRRGLIEVFARSASSALRAFAMLPSAGRSQWRKRRPQRPGSPALAAPGNAAKPLTGRKSFRFHHRLQRAINRSRDASSHSLPTESNKFRRGDDRVVGGTPGDRGAGGSFLPRPLENPAAVCRSSCPLPYSAPDLSLAAESLRESRLRPPLC